MEARIKYEKLFNLGDFEHENFKEQMDEAKKELKELSKVSE